MENKMDDYFDDYVDDVYPVIHQIEDELGHITEVVYISETVAFVINSSIKS